MIKQLKPFPGEYVPPPKTPTCQAHVQPSDQYDRNWRLRKGQKEPFTCHRDSVVELGGFHYCRLHGGHRVLDMYLKGSLIKATPESVPCGTKAPAIMGGWWYKLENGWKWNGPDGNGGTFPGPGGDWDGTFRR